MKRSYIPWLVSLGAAITVTACEKPETPAKDKAAEETTAPSTDDGEQRVIGWRAFVSDPVNAHEQFAEGATCSGEQEVESIVDALCVYDAAKGKELADDYILESVVFEAGRPVQILVKPKGNVPIKDDMRAWLDVDGDTDGVVTRDDARVVRSWLDLSREGAGDVWLVEATSHSAKHEYVESVSIYLDPLSKHARTCCAHLVPSASADIVLPRAIAPTTRRETFMYARVGQRELSLDSKVLLDVDAVGEIDGASDLEHGYNRLVFKSMLATTDRARIDSKGTSRAFEPTFTLAMTRALPARSARSLFGAGERAGLEIAHLNATHAQSFDAPHPASSKAGALIPELRLEAEIPSPAPTATKAAPAVSGTSSDRVIPHVRLVFGDKGIRVGVVADADTGYWLAGKGECKGALTFCVDPSVNVGKLQADAFDADNQGSHGDADKILDKITHAYKLEQLHNALLELHKEHPDVDALVIEFDGSVPVETLTYAIEVSRYKFATGPEGDCGEALSGWDELTNAKRCDREHDAELFFEVYIDAT